MNLTIKEIYALQLEIKGSINQETGEQITMGILKQPLFTSDKMKMHELFDATVPFTKIADELQKELHEKYATEGEGGKKNIPVLIEENGEKIVNPVAVTFLKEKEEILSLEKELEIPKLDKEKFEFKTNEDYPVFYKILKSL